jgi:hypothetical protein
MSLPEHDNGPDRGRHLGSFGKKNFKYPDGQWSYGLTAKTEAIAALAQVAAAERRLSTPKISVTTGGTASWWRRSATTRPANVRLLELSGGCAVGAR